MKSKHELQSVIDKVNYAHKLINEALCNVQDPYNKKLLQETLFSIENAETQAKCSCNNLRD